MPNWTFNSLTTNKEGFFNQFINDEGDFDFNTLIPMPAALNVESSSDTPVCIVLALMGPNLDKPCSEDDFRKVYIDNGAYLPFCGFTEYLDRATRLTPGQRFKQYRIGLKLKQNLELYGATDWYDWSRENWGTKWNACETVVNEDGTEVRFSTAWSHPHPIFIALANYAIKNGCELEIVSEYEEGDVFKFEVIDDHFCLTETGHYSYDDDDEGEYCVDSNKMEVIF